MMLEVDVKCVYCVDTSQKGYVRVAPESRPNVQAGQGKDQP